MLRHLECRILELLEIPLHIWWGRLGSMSIVGLPSSGESGHDKGTEGGKQEDGHNRQGHFKGQVC